MRGEIWGDHRMERRSDFLDKDDCETGEGDQDEGGRTPTQLLKMNAAAYGIFVFMVRIVDCCYLELTLH